MSKMIKLAVKLLATFSLFRCVVQDSTPDLDCGIDPGKARTLRFSLNSKKNQSGDWVDTFTAKTESGNSTSSVGLDITHSVYECKGKRIIYIQGVSNVAPVEIADRRLSFHPRCGKNIAIINKGRTVQKIINEDPLNSVVFTNRPLRDNEIFEIKLDKKNTKFSYALGIGIIKSTAEEVDILPEMYKSPVTLMYHNGNIYSNGKEIFTNYGKNINELQVGDRLGVMRSEFGTLHFFVNGVDQGAAASNIPSVYGVLELWYNAMKATIVDAPTPS